MYLVKKAYVPIPVKWQLLSFPLLKIKFFTTPIFRINNYVLDRKFSDITLRECVVAFFTRMT